MPDLHEVLHRASAPTATFDRDDVRRRARTLRRRRSWHRGAALVAALIAIVVVVGAVRLGTAPSEVHTLGTVPGGGATTTTMRSTTTSTPQPVRVRLELPASSLAARATMDGRVIVDNDSGHPIQATGCGSPFAARLMNDQL